MGAYAECEEIARVVGTHRYHYADEYQLQDGVARALEKAGWTVWREFILTPRDRIDLLVSRDSSHWFGVEVKVAGNAAKVAAQLRRYVADKRVEGVVLVTSRIRHLAPRAEKPIQVVCLAGQGL
jgi:hypothetical protein